MVLQTVFPRDLNFLVGAQETAEEGYQQALAGLLAVPLAVVIRQI